MDLFQIISSTLELFSISAVFLVTVSYGVFKLKDKKKDKISAEKPLFSSQIELIEPKIEKEENFPPVKAGKFKRIEPETIFLKENPSSTNKREISSKRFQVYNSSELSRITFR